MLISDVIRRMVDLYIADSGLGRLDPYPKDSKIAPNGVETCNNDNGILCLTFMLVKALEAGAFIAPELFKARATIKSLETITGEPGLYNRQPRLITVFERHDNYVAICVLCAILGDTETPKAMIRHWWFNKFCFNNVHPGRFNWEQFRQPGEVALYYIAAKKRPPFLFSLWLFVGIIINANKKELDAAQARLVWLRLYLIDKAGIKGFIQKFLYKQVKTYWFKRTLKKYSRISALFSFGEGHPVTDYQKIIDNTEK